GVRGDIAVHVPHPDAATAGPTVDIAVDGVDVETAAGAMHIHDARQPRDPDRSSRRAQPDVRFRWHLNGDTGVIVLEPPAEEAPQCPALLDLDGHAACGFVERHIE